MKRKEIEMFRDLKIDKKSLVEVLGGNPIYIKSDDPVRISVQNVKQLIEFYSTGKINVKTMIEWCDIIRFSELYDYPDSEPEQEIIAVIIDEIQDTEVFKRSISDEDIARWILLIDKCSIHTEK